MKNTDYLIQECHKTSVEKGFYDDIEPSNQHFIGTQIALMHSEIDEAYDEVVKGYYSIYYRSDGKPEGFVVEMADFLIRIFDLCGYLNLYLTPAFEYVDSPSVMIIDEELEVIKELEVLHREISEALEQLRDNRYDVVYMGSEYEAKGMVLDFAKCINRTITLCRAVGVNIFEALEIKMEYNKGRKYKHGRENF